jgi:primosomal protein N' (replication factor Y)
MRYAEVSVNSPAAQRRAFSYAIPSGRDIREGQAVLVPFGEKVLQGVVLELSPVPAVADTREIIDVIESRPVLSSYHLSLARWICDYYLSPLFDAVALMLPPGFERRTATYIGTARPDIDADSLDDDWRKILELISGQDKVELKKLEKTLGKKKAAAIVSAMVRQGLLTRIYELGPVRVKPKRELYLALTGDTDDTSSLPARQATLFRYLIEKRVPVSWSEARRQTGCSKSIAQALVDRGVAAFQEVEVRREPISYENIVPSRPLPLTPGQQSVLGSLRSGLARVTGESPSPGVYLLHGVTGSGKTEIYLQALAEAVRMGKRGIILVPEIALTPQTIERFATRFPHRVAVLHSRLSLGEQYDEWHRIRDGEFDVVIGSRSAIFAPQPDLGLIIIDEEHEWTYKQDNSPHYHARDVAVRLVELTGALVLLGSATPDVETYYRAQNNEYKLLTLPERVVPAAGSPLPRVEVVDMREELKAGNRSMFSRSLSRAVNEAVAAGEQVILFLNRRGGATFIQCRSCGFVLRCRRCEVPLSQDIAEDILTCHQCGYKTPVPRVCPNCSSPHLKFLGAGTQKLEQEIRYEFPRARQIRWDSDVTRGRASHETILRKFRNREADILVGTQMIAKGLDIPTVTLVGVISADTSLNLPDFRAGERTFQLLSQVAGRAGRGPSGGRVIIQTFSPEHYAIQAAASHDYASFYEREIAYRRQLRNPPFTRLARLVYVHANDAACQREAEKMKGRLLQEMAARGIGGIDVIGPAPAYIHRLRGRFRWQLLLRGFDLPAFLSPVTFPQGWILDIDPMGLVQ